MPTLAKKIVDENTAGNNPVLNFKGLAVGNPLIDAYSYLPVSKSLLYIFVIIHRN
jgi:hypothetical protein